MKNTPVVLAAMVGSAMAAPQAQKAPSAAAPAGCKTTFADSFELSIVAAPEGAASVEKRSGAACSGSPGALVVKLKDGVLTDAQDRTGSIVANYQFQFDGPAQADALYTSGFSVCDDNLVALGDKKTFYKCNSGSFANLYDRNWAKQCSPVAFYVRSCGESKRSAQADYGAGEEAPSQPSHPVTQIGDGQLQVPTGEPPKPPTEPTYPAPEPQPEPSKPAEPEYPQPEPSTPAEPEYPPVEPSTPSEPEYPPVEPSTPAEPEYPPVEPSKPAEPEYPPAEPSTPAEPEYPPVEPSTPAEPEYPPVEPSKPAEPVYPEPQPEPTHPAEPTYPAPEPEHPVTQISDGQIQVPTGEPPAPPVETEYPAPPPAPPVETEYPAPPPPVKTTYPVPPPPVETSYPVPPSNTTTPPVVSPPVESGPVEAGSGRVIPGSVAALVIGAVGAFFML
ncbi:hypothetical protein ACHAQA_002996 [Verticillium albo-atrum]